MKTKAFGIISLINVDLEHDVRSMWLKIREILIKNDLPIQEHPHFSWLVARNYNVDKTLRSLERIAKNVRPFKIALSGIGIFSGETPILYLPIVRTILLSSIHRKIWANCRDYAEELNPYYSSEKWIPHITVTYANKDTQSILGVTQEIISNPLRIEIEVTNFVLAYQNEEESGLIGEIPFSAEDG